MITTLIVIPLTTLQFIIIVATSVIILCPLLTVTTSRFYDYHHRKWMETQQAEIDRRQKVLDEAMELQANRDIVVTEREEAVAEREQLLRQLWKQAKGAAAVIGAERQHLEDDTVIMTLDEEWRP